MLVGDKNRFAIEFELDAEQLSDPDLREWLNGRICFWFSGKRVGEYEFETTLRDVAIEAERFLRDQGNRKDESLVAASADHVVRIIAHALFEDWGQSDEQAAADERHYRRFVVSPEVDVFDQWRIHLVEDASLGRLIWLQEDENVTHECQLRPGEFDAVLKAFLVALRGESGG
jgi:Immunity protein 42